MHRGLYPFIEQAAKPHQGTEQATIRIIIEEIKSARLLKSNMRYKII